MKVEAPHDVRTVTSSDGTEICYTVCGEEGPVVVLAPGLATPFIVYKCIIERFAPFFRFVTWDMRATYRSGTPDTGIDAMGIEDHVKDLAAIVKQEELTEFTVGGWSAGVQISLEYVHQFPKQCHALILINGTYGHCFKDALNLPKGDRILTASTKVARRLAFAINPSLSFLLSKDRVIGLLESASFFSENRPFVQATIDEWRQLDFRNYLGLMLRLNEHSAESYLSEIDIPTLVTAGSRDTMTPVSLAQTMADRIAKAELVVIPNGTHYTQLEYPDIMNLAIEKFLRRAYPGHIPDGC